MTKGRAALPATAVGEQESLFITVGGPKALVWFRQTDGLTEPKCWSFPHLLNAGKGLRLLWK
jgi:hypothetical protein